MSVTQPTPDALMQARASEHPLCCVCGWPAEPGLGLRCSVLDDGRIEGHFGCDARFEGYTGLLHGGITSAVLDGAMTNCLFAHGIVALTAEMTVRFKHPVVLNVPLVVHAQMVRSQPPLHVVEAQLEQDGQLKAKATGKFMEKKRERFTP